MVDKFLTIERLSPREKDNIKIIKIKDRRTKNYDEH